MEKPSLVGDPVLRVAVVVIAVVLTFAALRAGSDIFAPMLLAAVTGVILAPVTDGLERIGIRAGLASVIVLLAGLFILLVLGILAEPLIWRVAEELPTIRWELRSIIEDFRGLIRGLDEMNKEVEEALGTQSTKETTDGESVMPNLSTALYFAPVVMAQVLVFVGTLFFFLLTRKGIYVWLARRIGSSADTVEVMNRFSRAERLVSRYFLTITVINLGLGAALGGALALIGLPAPIVWAFVAFLLNYILYIGPMILTAGLTLAGIVAFDGIMVLAPPAIFLFLNMMEAQFVTPSLVGKHISVNPLLVFVSLVIWLWLWGPIGAIIAIPVLAIGLVMLNIFDEDTVPPG